MNAYYTLNVKSNIILNNFIDFTKFQDKIQVCSSIRNMLSRSSYFVVSMQDEIQIIRQTSTVNKFKLKIESFNTQQKHYF